MEYKLPIFKIFINHFSLAKCDHPTDKIIRLGVLWFLDSKMLKSACCSVKREHQNRFRSQVTNVSLDIWSPECLLSNWTHSMTSRSYFTNYVQNKIKCIHFIAPSNKKSELWLSNFSKLYEGKMPYVSEEISGVIERVARER